MTDTVSLCVIALNEEAFLPNLLKDLSSQTYPKEKTEIVLIDSGSRDRSRQIMEDFKAEHGNEFLNIQVLDNPRRIQAAGWNVAIKSFSTDVIIRIDAHTHIPPEFTEKNMRNIQNGEYVCGGKRPCLNENKTLWGKTLLETENSLFGSSINLIRHSDKKQYVKTVFHAAYRREVFEKSGIFNEHLLRTEDNEMHYRIRQNGFKILYDPDIVSYQYARSSLKRMLKQKYGNGYWIGLTMGVAPGCISLFHFAPFCFVLGIILTTILSLAGLPLLSMLMWGAYAAFVLLSMLAIIAGGRANIYIIFMPLLFLALHISYGIGTVVGLVKMPFMKDKLQYDAD